MLLWLQRELVCLVALFPLFIGGVGCVTPVESIIVSGCGVLTFNCMLYVEFWGQISKVGRL